MSPGVSTRSFSVYRFGVDEGRVMRPLNVVVRFGVLSVSRDVQMIIDVEKPGCVIYY